jgi:hypothetical protein
MLILVRSQGGVFKFWNLATATLEGERRDVLPPVKPWEKKQEKQKKGTIYLEKIWDKCYLIHQFDAGYSFVFDLDSGQRTELLGPCEAAITPYGKTIAQHDWLTMTRYEGNWWTTFMIWLGLQKDPMTSYVTLNAFPSEEEIISLTDCRLPQFSPDGNNLAIRTDTGGSLQLYDLPIRKPIGKILGLAALAAVATLLAINGLGWLRRRKIKTPVTPLLQ